MRKYLILLTICLPLAWVTYRQGARLYDLFARPVSADDVLRGGSNGDDPAADVEADRLALEASRKNAEAVVNLSGPVASAAVRVADGTADVDEAPEPKALTEPVLTLARAVAGARRQVEDLGRKSVALAQEIEDLRKRLLGDNGELRDRPDVVQQLGARVKEYQSLAIHNPELVRDANADMDWGRLQKENPPSALTQLFDKLDHWAPGSATNDFGPAEAVTAHVVALQDYLETYTDTKVPHVTRAREQLELWKQGARLLEIVRPNEESTRLEQLQALVALAQEDHTHAPGRFEFTARKLARALCADFLKPERLDSVVLVQSDESDPEQVQRKDIRVRWKSGKSQPLTTSGYDEYTLPRVEVENLFVNSGTRELPRDPSVPPLKGTPYSDAVHAFNVQREKVERWSEDDLLKLRSACASHREALARGEPGSGGASLLERIEKVLELASKHPRLFVASAP